MANLQKALELLDLPQELAPFDGQIKTRTQRQFRIYEVSDFSVYPMKQYYTFEFMPDKVESFGMYPLNYLAGSIRHFGFNYEGVLNGVATLTKPSAFVKHEAPSGLAGQTVYYVWTQLKASQQGIDFISEPYETVWEGKADDMTDPMIRVGYWARVITKGADGKPKISWTSKYAINPKRRIRKAEFLKMINMPLEDFMYKTRWTWNRVDSNPDTHINNIAMDIEQLPNNKFKSVFYINGVDAQTFNYKSLINSFDQTYAGYLWLYRLNNGATVTAGVDNVYGSTLNIGLDTTKDSTITVIQGSVDKWDATTKTLTYNPDLPYNASLISYMEFLPAGGKNENIGKEYFLETGIEKLF